jgi:ribonuclease P protein component
MLARQNRLLRAEDFRATMKAGRKIGSQHLVIYLKRVPGTAQARFGFVVGKNVGGAVNRNLVKRRLRAAALTYIDVCNGDLVVRALPGAAQLNWENLSTEFQQSINKALEK